MSTFEFELTESIESEGRYLKEPGKYHVMLTEVTPNPEKNGTPQMGSLKLVSEVLAGKHKGKIYETTLSKSLTNNDDEKWKNQRLTQLFVIFGGDHEGNKTVKPDVSQWVGRQIVLSLDINAKNPKYMNIQKMFHVDSKDASDVEKNMEYVNLIPSQFRGDPIEKLANKIAGFVPNQPEAAPAPSAPTTGALADC